MKPVTKYILAAYNSAKSSCKYPTAPIDGTILIFILAIYFIL